MKIMTFSMKIRTFHVKIYSVRANENVSRKYELWGFLVFPPLKLNFVTSMFYFEKYTFELSHKWSRSQSYLTQYMEYTKMSLICQVYHLSSS